MVRKVTRTAAFVATLASVWLFAMQSAAAPDAAQAPTAAAASVAGPAPASAAAPASLPAADPNDPGGIFNLIVQAIRESRWAWLVGLLFMLATWAVNRLFKERIPKKVLPWVAIGLGVGSNIALCLAGGMAWYEAIGQGISLGMAASGGWSAFGKHLFSKEAKT